MSIQRDRREEKTYILPPNLSGQTYGKLFIRIGRVHYLRYGEKDYVKDIDLSLLKFIIKFWGDDQSQIFLRCENSDSLEYTNAVSFDIKTTPQEFFNYLSEMNALVIPIYDAKLKQEIANTIILLKLYINKKRGGQSGIDVEGGFPIMMSSDKNKKIGEVELTLSSTFYPPESIESPPKYRGPETLSEEDEYKNRVKNRTTNTNGNGNGNGKNTNKNRNLNKNTNIKERMEALRKVTGKARKMGSRDKRENKQENKQERKPKPNTQPPDENIEIPEDKKAIEEILARGAELMKNMEESAFTSGESPWREMHGVHPHKPYANNTGLVANTYAIDYDIDDLDPHPHPDTHPPHNIYTPQQPVSTPVTPHSNKRMEEMDRVLVRIEGLRVLGESVISRIREDKLHIQLKIPIKPSSPTNYHIMKVRCNGILENQNVFQIKSTSHFPYTINEENFGELINEFFIIQLLDSDTGDILAVGKLSFHALVLAQGYSVDKLIKLMLNDECSQLIPTRDVANKSSKSTTKSTKSRGSKRGRVPPVAPQVPVLPEKHKCGRKEEEEHVGDIRIMINLYNEKESGGGIMNIESPNKQLKPLNQPREPKFTPLPLELLVKISNCSNINLREFESSKEDIFPNVFIRYKNPGDGSEQSTETIYNTQNPNFSHSQHLPFPLSEDIILSTERNSMVFEVWDKISPERNSLIGLSKVPLGGIYKRVVQGGGGFSPNLLLNGIYPHFLLDGGVPVFSTKVGGSVGNVNITLALGTFQQVAKYLDKLKERGQGIPKPVSPPIFRGDPDPDPDPEAHEHIYIEGSLEKSKSEDVVEDIVPIEEVVTKEREEVSETGLSALHTCEEVTEEEPSEEVDPLSIHIPPQMEEGKEQPVPVPLPVGVTTPEVITDKRSVELKRIGDRDSLEEMAEIAKLLNEDLNKKYNLEEPPLSEEREGEDEVRVGTKEFMQPPIINTRGKGRYAEEGDTHSADEDLSSARGGVGGREGLGVDRERESPPLGSPLISVSPQGEGEGEGVLKDINTTDIPISMPMPIPMSIPPVDEGLEFSLGYVPSKTHHDHAAFLGHSDANITPILQNKSTADIVPPQATHTRHVFQVQILELSNIPILDKLLEEVYGKKITMDNQYINNICVRYSFPFEDKIVESDYITAIPAPNAHSPYTMNFKVNVGSEHVYVLEENNEGLRDIMGDQPFNIQIAGKNIEQEYSVIGNAQLPIEDIAQLLDTYSSPSIEQGGNELIRILFIYGTPFSDRENCIIGKLKMKIVYSREPILIQSSNPEMVLEKETRIERELPLEGFVTWEVKEIKELEESQRRINVMQSIVSQRGDNLSQVDSESPNLCIRMSIFEEDEDLRTIIPPIIAEVKKSSNMRTYHNLQTDRIEQALSLSTPIINYFQNHGAFCELLQVSPGADISGGGQRYLSLGHVKIPLLGIITSVQGIHSLFDLVNDFGQIIGVINLHINYSKPEVIEKNLLLLTEIPKIQEKIDRSMEIKGFRREYEERMLIPEKNELMEETKEFEREVPVKITDSLGGGSNSGFPIRILVESGIRIKNPLHEDMSPNTVVSYRAGTSSTPLETEVISSNAFPNFNTEWETEVEYKPGESLVLDVWHSYTNRQSVTDRIGIGCVYVDIDPLFKGSISLLTGYYHIIRGGLVDTFTDVRTMSSQGQIKLTITSSISHEALTTSKFPEISDDNQSFEQKTIENVFQTLRDIDAFAFPPPPLQSVESPISEVVESANPWEIKPQGENELFKEHLEAREQTLKKEDPSALNMLYSQNMRELDELNAHLLLTLNPPTSPPQVVSDVDLVDFEREEAPMRNRDKDIIPESIGIPIADYSTPIKEGGRVISDTSQPPALQHVDYEESLRMSNVFEDNLAHVSNENKYPIREEESKGIITTPKREIEVDLENRGDSSEVSRESIKSGEFRGVRGSQQGIKPPLGPKHKLSDTVKKMNMKDMKDREIDRIARIMRSSEKRKKKSQGHSEGYYSSDSDCP